MIYTTTTMANTAGTASGTGITKTKQQPRAALFMRWLLALLMMVTVGANAQVVSVTNPGNTTPALSATYGSLALAITDLNTRTAISGPVTITLNSANPQTCPAGGYSISPTLTGASNTNRVTIAGSGNTITAPNPAGTAGNLNDAIFKIIGSDFITISNFVMNENILNTTTAAATNNMVEWGVALLYASTTNGAQNNIIENNTITLNRTYQNTFGIYSNSTHSATSIATPATATTMAGGNSGLKVYGNTISNVNIGILVLGPTAGADHNTGIDIGGTGGAQANTISNFGTTGTFSGYANVSGTVNGILMRNSIGFNISFNSITSSLGGVTSGTLRGIYNVSASNTPTGTYTNNINNNTLALTYGVATGTLQGIAVEAFNATTTSIQNINNNNFTALTASIATSATINAISTVAPHLTVSISGNTFTNISTNTSGSFTFFANNYSMPAAGTQTLNNNSIVTAFNKTTAGGTVTISTSSSSSPNGSTHTFTNNNFSNITVTGATAIAGVMNTDGAGTSPNRTVIGNTFSNWTGGTGTITGMSYSYIGATSNFTSNTFSNITGEATIRALTIGSSFNGGTPLNINSNTITNLTSTGNGGVVTGITCSNTSATININNNAVSALASTGPAAVQGIVVSGPAPAINVFKNTICDISGSDASTTVNGIAVGAGTTVTVYNNRIGDLRATAANAANPLIGISITGGTTANVFYNTVNLNASSSGAFFGSSAISVSTTPTIALNNNIFVNNSSTQGPALAVAYRRSTATLTSYAGTSDRNDFFASTIYTDGITPQASLAAYKALVATRDANSIAVNPSFLSTTCGNANFLKIDPAIASQIESGGANIAGITDDFENTIRQGNPGYLTQVNGGGTAPDLGADEYDGIPEAVCGGTPAASTITGAASVCFNAGTALGLSTIYTDLGITYQWSSGTTPGGPYPTTLGTGATQATGPLTVNTYYICTITCTNSGLSYVTVEKSVLVNALPTVTVTPTSASICQPGGTAVSLTAGGAVTYAWSPTSGLTPTSGSPVSANPTATTTYTVTGTDANGCVNTASAAITLSSAVVSPTAAASPNPVCTGGTLNLTSSAIVPGYTINGNSGVAFIDISGTGTSVGTIADDSEHPLTIPSFTFNGVAYTTARVGNNGVLAFGATAGDINYSNRSLPAPLGANNTDQLTGGLMSNVAGSTLTAICANWDDMTPGTGGSIKTQTVGNIYVVQWTNEDNFDATGTGTITFQIQLDLTTGQIHLVYSDINYGVPAFDGGASATIGLNYSATSADQYSNLTASLVDGQSITFTPNLPTFSWSGPNGFTSNAQNPTITNVQPTASGVYTVTFTSPAGCTNSVTTANVTVTPTANAGSVSGTSPLCTGGTATYSSTGDAGGTWSSDNGAVATVNPTTGLVTAVSAGSANITYTVTGCNGPASASQSVTVNGPYTLTYTAGAGGSISGASPQTVNCGDNGSSVTAVPNTCYSFVNWSDGNTNATRTDLNIQANLNVTANFAIITYFATVSPGFNGTITPVGGTVNCGSDVTYIITPISSCHRIADVVLNGVSQGPVSSLSVNNISANYTLLAFFELIPYTITVSAGANGSISPSTGIVNCGSGATYTITPDACYSIADVVVDGVSQGALSTYTFTNVTAPHTISASFTAIPNANAGTVSGTSPLCIGGTATYIATGVVLSGGTGAWSSTNPSVASVNPTSGLVTALAAGTTNITYTITGGCGGTSSAFQTLTVDPNANAGTVSGTSPLCIGGTASYSSTGDAGGTWSSDNGAVATVNPTTGLVTAVSAGSANITYTVTGCNGPASGSQSVTVDPNVNAGTVSGTSPLCIGGTATYSSTGDAGGTWSSDNGAVATVNPTSGLVTAVSAGSANITYTVTGCNGPASASQSVTVNPNVNAGTVSGTSPLCIGGTATYSSTGDAGGTWSSSNASVATVNASSGLVTAVSAGSANITYTVTGCNGPASASHSLTVNPNVNAGTVSGTSPLLVSQTATYSSTGDAGGTWSSTSPSVASVNPTSGLVTALSAGSTNITYTATGCGGTQSAFQALTVNANIANPGTVTGTTPLCIGATATYTSTGDAGGTWSSTNPAVASVNPTSGLVTALSAGTTNITYTVAGPASSFQTLTVSPNVNAGTVTGTSPICVSTSTTFSSNGNAGGTWSSSNPAVATVNPTTGLVTAVSGGTATITYIISSGCGSPVSASAPISVASGAALTVSGAVNVCPFVGTPTTVTYTATSAGTTGYNWVLPPNVTLVSGAGTSTITVTFAAGFTAQANKQIKVTASSICGTSAQTIYYLLAQFPTTPGAITGPTDACPLLGTSATYSVAPVVGASSYIWTAQAGTTIVPAGPGTLGNTVTITFPTTFTTSAVTVQVVNACGTSGTRSLTIVRNNPSVPSLISGPTNACAHIAPGGTPATYTVPAVAGITTYTWTVPAGAIGLTGQGTNTISFTYPSGYTSGTVSVKVTNGCGTSEPRSLTIGVLQPATPGVIDVAVTTPCPNRVYTYSLPGLTANATSILWTVTGGTILGGNGTSSITVSYPSTAVNGSVTAQAINNCSVSTIRSTAVRLPACPLNPPPPVGKNSGNYNTEEARDNTVKTTLPTEASMEVKIYPNPTVRDFIMKVITASGEEINVRVIDNQGRLYKSFRVMPYQTIALGAELKPGSYLVEVRQGTQVKTTKVIKF